MSGIQFEEFVAAVLRHNDAYAPLIFRSSRDSPRLSGLAERGAGYEVNITNTTGDYGVDRIAAKHSVRIAVQCKRQARPVGVAAIQQAVAGAAMHRCTATMVVSNNLFTQPAQRLAQIHSCELVDRFRLEQLVIQTRRPKRSA
jgi:HJR/Mrr/RecB family endonuclease